MTVLKAGFLFSGRAGSGVIVARLPDGGWSAPSAVVTAGAGVGGQIGAEITDFVFILNTAAAVKSFSQAGSITLGGNVSLAAGPLGRNAEAAGSANLGNVAAIFAYSKTKGLFAGVSLEGSVLVERREANRKFYGNNCTAKQILSGRVEPPPACDSLFRVLETRAFRGVRPEDYDDFYDDIPDEFSDADSYQSGNAGYNSSRNRSGSNSRRQYDYEDDGEDDEYYSSSGRRGNQAQAPRKTSTKNSLWEDDVYDQEYYSSSRRVRSDSGSGNRLGFKSTYSDHPDRPSAPKPRVNGGGSGSASRGDAPKRYDQSYKADRGRESLRQEEAKTGGQKAVALYNFNGEQSGDLSFRKGDIITIVKKSDTTDTWWTGSYGGQSGIFPANYVELM